MVDSSDHITGKTGLTVAVTLSKAGAAFGAAAGSIAEIGSGWYSASLTTGDTDTLGDLAFHCTSAGADPTDFLDEVLTRLNDDLAFPATSGRSIVVDASGLVDANAVKIGPTGAGTAQTARDVGASVLLSTGTGTGQLDFTSGVVKANATQWVSGTIPAVNTTGVPKVDLILGAGATIPSGAIPNAVAGAAGGLFIAGTNAATTVTTALTTTFTGNLTGSVASVTGAVGSVGTGGITAATIADGAIDRATFTADTGLLTVRSNTAQAGANGTITLDASASAVDSFYVGEAITITGATGIGQTRIITAYVGATKVATVDFNWATNPDNTSTFAILPVSIPKVDSSLQVVSSSVQGNVTGTVATLTTYTGNIPQTGDVYALANGASGFVAVKGDTAAVKTQTDKLAFTVTNQVDANVLDWKSATAPAMTGDAFARLGAPVGASISADIAEIEGETDTLITGVVVTTNNDKTGYTIAAGGIGTTGITAGGLNAIADATLDRNMATGTDSGTDSTVVRTARQALRVLRNKASIAAGTLTVLAEDDATTSWTAAVTTTAGNPISTIDPT